MICGSSSFDRVSADTVSGIMPVEVAPPGRRAFTVTPVSPRFWAHMIVSDSRAAFDEP
jgi:hypothetical protein